MGDINTPSGPMDFRADYHGETRWFYSLDEAQEWIAQREDEAKED